MKVLVIGSGGREHALAQKIADDRNDIEVFISPGNGGTINLGKNINLSDNEIKSFCLENKIDLVVIGPEKPLVDGLANELRSEGIKVFGPNKEAAIIEGDKKFAKDLMKEFQIPTADYVTFTQEQYNEALDYLEKSTFPIVIKATGIAAGKGVLIPTNFEEAKKNLNIIFKDKKFGSAGNEIVIEEFLEGEELSVFAITDGKEFILLPASQDHKRIGEGDTGKNTGGMGAYSPLNFMNEEIISEIQNKIVIPTLKGMESKNRLFNGCLYCGLIKTNEGIKVIEYNCRFGDPETQAVLQLIDGDFTKLLLSAAEGKIDKTAVNNNNGNAICVVAVSGGYPDSYENNVEVANLPNNTDEVIVFHAGTKTGGDKLLTNGGRVFNVVAYSKDKSLKECKELAYRTIEKINFKNIFYRNDIGFKQIK